MYINNDQDLEVGQYYLENLEKYGYLSNLQKDDHRIRSI